MRQKAWVPPAYKPNDILALQAVSAGNANEEQQKRAIDWVIRQAAGTYEVSFRSDADGGERDTAFAEGRRFVGLQLVKLLSMSGGMIEGIRKNDG